jgi:mono/diheme cytochrome c family protein
MKNLSSISFLVVSLAFSIHSFAREGQKVNPIAEGARIYNENCGRCHNPRPASDYSQKEWSVVMPHMREKAHMTGEETLAVEAFITSTLTADRPRQRVPEQSNKDEPVLDYKQVLEKYGCQGCHQVNGQGGALGPPLDGVIKSRGVDYFKKKLKNPKFNNPASPMPKFPITKQEIEVLIEALSQ